MKKTRKYGDMTVGSPVLCMLTFAIPMIIGNMVQQIYNIADSVIVGNYVSSEALAAVGASSNLCGLFIMIAIGTGIGCSVVISQLYGAGRLKEMKTAISTALISILVFSLILSIIGRTFSGPILKLLQTPGDILADSKLYLDIYFYGFFFLFLYNAFNAVFNSLGISLAPLVFLIFSSCLNIGLDYWFVAILGWGIAGAAWATFISQAVSAVLSFIVLMFVLSRIKCEKYERFDTGLFKNMSMIALPTVLQQSMISIGMILIQACVNQFGSVFLAGYTAACRIDGLAIVPMVNAGNAVSTFVAQNMGAGQKERVKQGYHVGLAMAAGFGIVLGVVLHFLGGDFVGMFMKSEAAAESIAIGATYIGVCSMFYFVMGAMNSTSAVLRGSGDMKWFTMITIVNLVVRVVLTYTFAKATNGMIIMWANPIGWGIGLILAMFRYKQGGWKDIKVV